MALRVALNAEKYKNNKIMKKPKSILQLCQSVLLFVNVCYGFQEFPEFLEKQESKIKDLKHLRKT
jgi:hypothetical protein